MLTSFKIFEELKRKSPKDFEIGSTFDADKTDGFSKTESDILKEDDFTIDGNTATNKETYCTFEIKTTHPDEFTLLYELIIKDLKGDVIRSKKFKTDLYHKTDYLNTVLNICARFHEDLVQDAHKDLDPYNEEDWSDKKEPLKVPENDAVGEYVRRRQPLRMQRRLAAEGPDGPLHRRQAINNEIEIARRIIINDEPLPKIIKKFKRWFGKEKPYLGGDGYL